MEGIKMVMVRSKPLRNLFLRLESMKRRLYNYGNISLITQMKEAQRCNEKYVLEKCIAYMRMASDAFLHEGIAAKVKRNKCIWLRGARRYWSSYPAAGETFRFEAHLKRITRGRGHLTGEAKQI